MRGKFSISVKRVYEQPSAGDGLRMLVDRLWPRGISKGKAKIDEWLRDVAPTDELRKWFSHDPSRWDEFKARYRKELEKKSEMKSRIWADLSKGNVTLLYAAKDTEHNNASRLKIFLTRAMHAPKISSKKV